MKRFSNILLVADAAMENSVALQRATALAISNQASLTVIDVVDSVPAELQMAIVAVTPQELVEIEVSERLEHLEKVADAAEKKGLEIKKSVLVGKPFLEIIRQVLLKKFDLVIKAAEPAGGLHGLAFGGTDMRLLRKCPCPVWIIKKSERENFRQILAAVDLDPTDAVSEALSRQIIELATSLALSEFAELHVVHAWSVFGEGFSRARLKISHIEMDALLAEEASRRGAWLEELVRTRGAKAGADAAKYLDPQLHLIKGDAKHVVPNLARELDIDLVVMGTVARTGIPGFIMGNTAENILGQLDCSVLTVKPPGFVSPVTPMD